MGKKCVAAGCNNTHKNNVSLFKFPKDKNLRMQWIKEVQRTRASWKEPGVHSCVCSCHFTLDCFQPISLTSKKLGLTRKQMIKPDAVPTIFHKPDYIPKPIRNSKAQEKRERARESSTDISEVNNPSSTTVLDDDLQLAIIDAVELTTHESACVSEDSKYLPSERDISDYEDQVNIKPIKKSIKIQVKPSRWHVETQTDTPQPIQVCDVGIQCCLLPSELPRSSTPVPDNADSTLPAPDLHVSTIEEKMSLYEPSTESLLLPEVDPVEEKKYIVFESNLLALFRRCSVCQSPATQIKMKSIGTFLNIQTVCDDCEHKEFWNSQPYIRNIPAGNILLSAAILFSGALPAKSLRVFNVLNCASIVFYKHQRKYLQPSVSNVWTRQQSAMVAVLNAEKKGLVIGGDGRCDSPGFSAKYGAYSFMELEYNVVLNIELVQSNEVNGSYHMEKEGLIRGIKFFETAGLDLSILITDRHRAIAKWIQDTLPEVQHMHDVWHIAKGLRKKLEELSKRKSCELVREWTRSIVNHLYWSIMSTEDGNSEEVLEKWLSLINHIHDKHSGHGKIYKECPHGQIKRKWFKHHTKASEELKKIISNKNLCNDIMKASNSYQTSRLEAFHSLINQFAPKHTCFSYTGMKTRLLLSAIHYNHNSYRPQATTKDGKARYCIMFPKYKKGGYITRKIKTDSKYNYVNEVMEELLHIVETAESDVITEHQPTPPPLCSNYIRPDKTEAVKEHMSRFQNQ